MKCTADFIIQVDWVTMNFVPFAERCVELVTDMYKTTAQHSTVITSHVLQHIIKVSAAPYLVKFVPYFFGCKMEIFSFENNPKNLDPSYKMDLAL